MALFFASLSEEAVEAFSWHARTNKSIMGKMNFDRTTEMRWRVKEIP
jgi:hypothetical protein